MAIAVGSWVSNFRELAAINGDAQDHRFDAFLLTEKERRSATDDLVISAPRIRGIELTPAEAPRLDDRVNMLINARVNTKRTELGWDNSPRPAPCFYPDQATIDADTRTLQLPAFLFDYLSFLALRDLTQEGVVGLPNIMATGAFGITTLRHNGHNYVPFGVRGKMPDIAGNFQLAAVGLMDGTDFRLTNPFMAALRRHYRTQLGLELDDATVIFAGFSGNRTRWMDSQADFAVYADGKNLKAARVRTIRDLLIEAGDGDVEAGHRALRFPRPVPVFGNEGYNLPVLDLGKPPIKNTRVIAPRKDDIPLFMAAFGPSIASYSPIQLRRLAGGYLPPASVA